MILRICPYINHRKSSALVEITPLSYKLFKIFFIEHPFHLLSI